MVSEETRRHKKIVFLIIIFAIFIYLIAYIGMFIVNIYKENKYQTEEIVEYSYDCSTYVYDILEDTISYDGNVLEFKIKNTIGEPFDILVIDTGSGTYKAQLENFRAGESQIITIEDNDVDESVIIYPQGCEKDNKKVFNIP